ncbi:MAG: zf-HC2 domain-containing protein [Bacteroidota bacterium]
MNKKINEHKLTAYLYGELSGQELEEVKNHLDKNPEEKKRVEELNQVRRILGKLEEKEVIEPVFIWPEENLPRPENDNFYHSNWFKIACSITLFIVIFFISGYFLSASLKINNGSFVLGFNSEDQSKIVAPVQEFTAEDIESIIDKKLSSISENNTQQFQELSDQIQLISNKKVLDSGKIISMLDQESNQLNNNLQAYANQIQEENINALRDLVVLSSKQQQAQFETTLVEFSKYLEQKRNDDLNFILLNLKDLKQHSDNYKSKTNEILASLIEKVNDGNN